jgi:hypothetical protein
MRIQTIDKSKPSIQANFAEERHTSILKEPVRNQGKIWATLPDKIRREIGGNTPSATVIDGKKMVVYYPNLKEEEVYDLEKRPRLKDSLRALMAGLDFQQLRTDSRNILASRSGPSQAEGHRPPDEGRRRFVCRHGKQWRVLRCDVITRPSLFAIIRKGSRRFTWIFWKSGRAVR